VPDGWLVFGLRFAAAQGKDDGGQCRQFLGRGLAFGNRQQRCGGCRGFDRLNIA
jgi:hypothetical protein